MPLATRRMFLTVGGVAASLWAAARTVRAAVQPWSDRRASGPFACVAQFPLDSLDRCFQDLARLQRELERTLGLQRAATTVDVYLLADEEAYSDFVRNLYPRAPYRRALYVLRGGRAAVYAYRHDDLPVDLRHECTHALLHANLPTVPLWLDEGLAEYFEMPEDQRAFDHPHLATLRWNLRFGMLRSVESLEQHSELSEMGGIEYRFAWAWVHFMLHGPVAAHRALVQYLAEIHRGESPGPLSERLREGTPHLEDRMIQHFQRWRRA
jgi:hypothetical protein